MRDKEGFRDQYAVLKERFPEREAITLDESCALLGISRKVALGAKDFPAKKIGGRWTISLMSLARWMC